MTYSPNSDYFINVRKGLVPGHVMIGIRGHDASVPNGGPFGLSPEFGGNSYVFDQSAIAATPAVVGIASTDNTNDIAAGTGALTVLIVGLDASGDVQSESVTMTGQTAANTVATFSAVDLVTVLTTGSNNANVGTIYVGTGTFTAGVPAVRMLSMAIGANLTSSAYYVVPNAKKFYLHQIVASVATSNKDVELFISTSSDGLQWNRSITLGLQGASLVIPVKASPAWAAGTHLKIDATGGAASSDVSALLEGVLIDD